MLKLSQDLKDYALYNILEDADDVCSPNEFVISSNQDEIIVDMHFHVEQMLQFARESAQSFASVGMMIQH